MFSIELIDDLRGFFREKDERQRSPYILGLGIAFATALVWIFA